MAVSEGGNRPPGRRTPGRMAGGASYVLIAILAIFTLVALAVGGPRACNAPDNPHSNPSSEAQKDGLPAQ